MLFDKPWPDIGFDDVQALVDRAEPESTVLDYKSKLPGGRDADKKDFCKDVSALANTRGGYLLYGVDEAVDADGKKTGLPGPISGVGAVADDHEMRRLDQIHLHGIEQRIPGVQMKMVAHDDGRKVLLVRVPKSVLAPHMIKADGSFWARAGNANYRLDLQEIRDAMLATASLSDRIAGFHAERVARARAGDGPVQLRDGPLLVLHLVPVSSFSTGATGEALPTDPNLRNLLWPPFTRDHHFPSQRYNLDGLIFPTVVDGIGLSYTQYFSSGIIEVADTFGLVNDQAPSGIPSVFFEKHLIDGIARFLKAYGELAIQPPVYLLATAVGVAGMTVLPAEREIFLHTEPIDRDVLPFPSVVVDDLNAEPQLTVRPLLDALWRAAGQEACPHYDEEGTWVFPSS